jgi:alpha-glucosidase (family GH31 glycosyl hydrolase)
MYVRPTFALYAPFFVSSSGYGLAVGGTTVGEFDLAKTAPDVVSFRFETGRLAEHQRLAFDVFVGPKHAQILDRYTARNGRPFVPPEWAFGHWRWRDELAVGNTGAVDGVTVQGQVALDLERYDALGLPAGIWLFDRPTLSGEYGFARFAWNPDQLPNQQQLLQSMRQRGWRVVTWSSTWTCGSTPGDHGLEAQGLSYHLPRPVGTPHCADLGGASFILDLTHPDAGGWWLQKIASFITGDSIDGIKLDRGEEHIPSLATDVWHDGRNGREGRNAYPTLQAQVHNQALRQAHPDGDFVLITRAGYTGTAQYAIAWGGDIPGSESFGSGTGTDLGLRSAIISQQRAAFMGYPIWGSDTGGYYQYKDGTVGGRRILGREVFARWLQFSTFSGIMEIGGKGSHAPWDMPSAPVDDTELTAIYVRYVSLRETLRPYIVSLLAEAARGTPLVRPLPFEFPADARARDRWDEYLFGPSLLVAPVWRSGDRQREVYFPKGRWRSYWDPSQVVRGPKTLTVDVPLDEIPVYVREGAPAVPGPE